jgi:hypothetical protein
VGSSLRIAVLSLCALELDDSCITLKDSIFRSEEFQANNIVGPEKSKTNVQQS